MNVSKLVKKFKAKIQDLKIATPELKLRTGTGFEFVPRNPSLDKPRATSILDLGSLLFDNPDPIDLRRPLDNDAINHKIDSMLTLRPSDLLDPNKFHNLEAAGARLFQTRPEVTPIEPELLNRWPFTTVGQVTDVFRHPIHGQVAGCVLGKGTFVWDRPVFVVRNDKFIFNGVTSSLRRFKDAVRVVTAGQEFGLSLATPDDAENWHIFKDFKIGDLILQNSPSE